MDFGIFHRKKCLCLIALAYTAPQWTLIWSTLCELRLNFVLNNHSLFHIIKFFLFFLTLALNGSSSFFYFKSYFFNFLFYFISFIFELIWLLGIFDFSSLNCPLFQEVFLFVYFFTLEALWRCVSHESSSFSMWEREFSQSQCQ